MKQQIINYLIATLKVVITLTVLAIICTGLIVIDDLIGGYYIIGALVVYLIYLYKKDLDEAPTKKKEKKTHTKEDVMKLTMDAYNQGAIDFDNRQLGGYQKWYDKNIK